MQDEEAVYADWSGLRAFVPAAIGLVAIVGVAIVGFLALRPEPELASQPVDQAESSQQDVEVASADPAQLAEQVLGTFLAGLEQGRFDGMTFAFSEPPLVAQEFEAIGSNLGPYTIEAVSQPVEMVDSANAKAPVVLRWELEDGTVFNTDGEVDLVLIGTEWQVDWEPSIVEASLDPGDTLIRERVVPPRAPILGRDGVPLVDNRPVFDIGVIPRQVDDIAALSIAIGQLIDEDPAGIEATIRPSPSDSTVLIATRRAEDIAGTQAQLSGLPGVVLEASTYPLAPNDRFGRALLGRSAEVTAEILAESPDLFLVGDIVGRSGLQREYNARLHGIPGFQVRVERRFPSSTPSTVAPTTSTTVAGTETTDDGQQPEAEPIDPDVVFLSPPTEGTSLNLTIDQRVQTAAENALAGTELVSALVAIEVSTGHILALANGPGAAVNNFAITGQYPPGSVFKTVTAYAAMENGYGLTDPVDCPLTINVNGRDFTNAEGEVLGTVPMRRAFVLSCNTAFINLASVLDPSDFPNTAAKFGIGVGYSLGTASFSGNVPTPGGPVDKAATSFGQSQILVSPLSAAVMAATAAGGTYRPPVLVLEPDAAPPADQPLDPTLAANLREILRAVVTSGTGGAVAGVAGGPVSGKTGTAEFGNADPPQAHAWFVGFQGDVAFAVFVEAGEFGGATAAPIAGSFLNQLAN